MTIYWPYLPLGHYEQLFNLILRSAHACIPASKFVFPRHVRRISALTRRAARGDVTSREAATLSKFSYRARTLA